MLMLKSDLRRKSATGPEAALVSATPTTSPIDAYKRVRDPSPSELLTELKNTAWTCASLNASVCAAHPPRLYVRTAPHQPRPKCLTRPLAHKALHRFAAGDATIEEVTDHPLLTLLQQVNPAHNAQDLWELTTFHQETIGSAYWLLDLDPLLGIPRAIWPLPAHKVRPVRRPGDAALVSCYELRNGQQFEHYPPEVPKPNAAADISWC